MTRSLATSAACAVALAVSTIAPTTRADIIAADHHGITATFEVADLNAHPEVLVVAFPFAACPGSFGDDMETFFRLNPTHDKAERNYEVLRPGVRYQVQKFCSNMELYAVEKSAVTTRTETAKEDLDWYRKKGHELTIIEELEPLKTSQKAAFMKSDKRVRPSGRRIEGRLVVPDAVPVTATHDVFAIGRVEPTRFEVLGKEVVVTLQESGRHVSIPFVDGKRPDLERVDWKRASAGDGPIVPAVVPSATPTTSPSAQPLDPGAAAGKLTAPAEEPGYGRWALIGILGVAALGVFVSLRRRRADGDDGKA